MEGVQQRKPKPTRLITQPVEDREALAGWKQTSPPCSHANTAPTYQTRAVNQRTVPVAVNEEEDISIRDVLHHEAPMPESFPSSVSISSSSASSSQSGAVVDMRQPGLGLHSPYVKLRQPGVTERDLSINVRDGVTAGPQRCQAVDDDLHDLDVEEGALEDLSFKKGPVSTGNNDDILKLLDDQPTEKGVICSPQVLHSKDGFYLEGEHYTISPGTQSRGAYGEAAICHDRVTGKMVIRKKVRGKFAQNEVKVPLRFCGNAGIPEVYGVFVKDQEVEIFQEFAGLSVKKMMDSEYRDKLQDPKMVLVLAFQAFATLDILHKHGVTHQDIKPENLCVDRMGKSWHLKFIDFGSSQMEGDLVTDGLTNEYLSPESCKTILQVATGNMQKEEGRLGPGTDVWAMALSLIYCLCGYHVMVYANTGHTMYQETDMELQKKRVQCLFKVAQFTDEDVTSKLINSTWPDVIRYLLYHTLRVNPAERWTANQAANFILTVLRGGVTPVEQKVAQPKPSSTATGFSLTPARLVIRPTAVATPQAVQSSAHQESQDAQPMQCSSPISTDRPPPSPSSTPSAASTPSSAAMLPDFDELMSNDLSKKATRPYKRRQTQRDCPYQPAVGRGYKVVKK